MVFIIASVCGALASIPVLMVTAPLWFPVGMSLYFLLKVLGVWRKVQKGKHDVYDWLLYRSNKPRKYLWRKFFNFLVWMFPQPEWKTMNFGYAINAEHGRTIELDPQDENERFSYQLYDYIATGMKELNSLKGLHVLEVGSGRGGGLYYISKYLNPASATGIDFSRSQIAFCNRNYRLPNLKFIEGDCSSLPIDSESIDILISIQSIHCFPNLSAFLSEAERVLKSGGRLLLADFLYTIDSEDCDLALRSLTLRVEKRVDMTENVLLSLHLDSIRRLELIEMHSPSCIQGIMCELGGVEGSRMYLSMLCGDRIYLGYEMIKD